MIRVYEQLSENPLDNYLGEFDVDIDNDTVVIYYEGDPYKILHKSKDNKTIIVGEVYFDIEADETEYLDWIECPICEQVQPYDTSTEKDDKFRCTCSDCGAELLVNKEHKLTYRTEVTKKPKIQLLE